MGAKENEAYEFIFIIIAKFFHNFNQIRLHNNSDKYL
jgi:hypothetical protein